jgi:hypothetical protein
MGALGRTRIANELGWDQSEMTLLAAYERASPAVRPMEGDNRRRTQSYWPGPSCDTAFRRRPMRTRALPRGPQRF